MVHHDPGSTAQCVGSLVPIAVEVDVVIPPARLSMYANVLTPLKLVDRKIIGVTDMTVYRSSTNTTT